ncbi:hypothetical protein GPECTOR_68g373 [Gonium pectorale]|uniref:Ion transport domain-containing protein n=1 Tax=Gonium pectorale TaxID=33097 RepID=A0A150G3E6_GONPE|nr:hypothetical protein GPECTOR_68g373 [Gonium pectorale]|eukprot:KXZ44402.1 hypothetical protein GPECTOR_68g373 [Gonium pectorale]
MIFLLSAIKSAKEKLTRAEVKAAVARAGSATSARENQRQETQTGDAADGTGLSQWQALQRKLQLVQEPAAPEADIAALLKAVFKEHMLTSTPEFTKYFANDGKVQTPAEVEASIAAQRDGAALAADGSQPHPNPHGSAGTSGHPSGHPGEPDAGAAVRPLAAVNRAWARFRASPLRLRIYLTLSHPEYSALAMCVGVFLLLVIILNTATFCVESIPKWEDTELYDRLVMVDYGCLAVFTVEFVLRMLCCPSLRRFVLDPMNWVDVVSIAPFYVELILMGPSSQVASQTRIVRLLRLLRILRILRATSRFRNLQVVVDSLIRSSDVIAMLALLLLVLLVVSSTIIYYIEGALIPDTWFDSIPTTMYYMHVTLTTTGYGDLYAQSSWGRFAAGVFMLLCMVTLSLPISVVGGNFSNLWSRYIAIRDGLARSSAAWATRGRLRQLACRHAAAMDDLITTINELKGGDALLALKEGVAELKSRLAWARKRQEELQALLAVSGRLVSRELSESLDRLHNAHKDMVGWSVDGAWLAERGRRLLADLRALRVVVEEEEEWLGQQAAEAAFGPGPSGSGSGAASASAPRVGLGAVAPQPMASGAGGAATTNASREQEDAGAASGGIRADP